MGSDNNNINKMANPNLNVNGWVEWRKYVLKSLDDLKKQHIETEDKIEDNRDMFVNAVSRLELSVTKEIGELTTEVKILKSKVAQRAMAMSAIIPFLTALGIILYNMIR